MAVTVGFDGVLTYLGTPHPCITIHFLITLGMTVLGLGALEVSTLLPLPLYSCWGGLTPKDFDKWMCKGLALLPQTSEDSHHMVQVCGEKQWQPGSFPGVVLVGIRVVVMLIAGICIDALGRRRSVVAWMGLYFVVAFARTFSPNPESVVFCITLEGASAQASTLALLMLAAEGSTQKECVRSACLVLLGHAVGVAAGAPLITIYVPGEVYQQMARSLPALVFVLFIIALPESARWVTCRGRVHEATVLLKKSHHMAFDPTVQPKLFALHEEHKISLRQHKCAGHALRESLQPLIRVRKLFLVLISFAICGFALGCAASATSIYDPTVFSSYEDRQIAYGVVEFLALLLLGLTVSRFSVKFVLVALMSSLPIALLVTPLLDQVSVGSCAAQLFITCMGHLCVVSALVWMGIGVIRLTPTHSRGAVLGFTFAAATLGHAIAHLSIRQSVPFLDYLDIYGEILVWALVAFIGGLLTLLMPKMPKSLPDTIYHLLNACTGEDKLEEYEEHQNTQL